MLTEKVSNSSIIISPSSRIFRPPPPPLPPPSTPHPLPPPPTPPLHIVILSLPISSTPKSLSHTNILSFKVYSGVYTEKFREDLTFVDILS